MTMPNFIIIGAGKCGTTSLVSYLSQHPEIYFSPIKEPRFFAFEGQQLDCRGPADEHFVQTTVTDLSSYKRLFEGVTTEKAIGEASTGYLHRPRAIERIKYYVPDARLITFLRDPVERAYSTYLMNVRIGVEPLSDFSKAIAEQDQRSHAGWCVAHNYISIGYYYRHLKPYINTFGRDQVRVYLYNDFKRDNLSIINDIFEYLDVDSTFVPDINKKQNAANLVPANRAIDWLLDKSVRCLNTSAKLITPGLAWRSRRLACELENTRISQYIKSTMPNKLRKKLISLYREDIIQLEKLIDRDLSDWLQ